MTPVISLQKFLFTRILQVIVPLINENTPNLSGQFQDSISNLIITTDTNQSDGYMVEICEHESYVVTV